MTNTALVAAMEDARFTRGKLAARVGVTRKTVERWISGADLVPHARNREDACSALGADEEMIWPQTVTDRVKTGSDRELVRSYAYRSACPSTTWAELTDHATQDIFLAGYTNYFLLTQVPAFAHTLERKARAGCRIRFLLGDPDGQVTRRREAVEDVEMTVSTRIRSTLGALTRLGPLENLETRFSHPEDAVNHVSLSVFRFDDEALVTPHLARLVGHDSPLLHLRRHGDQGMFDRFADHAEELWRRAVPPRR